VSVTRRQKLEIQLKPLLGSGKLGAIHHDSRAISLPRTSKQDGTNLIETSSLSEETDHSDPANFQEGRKKSYVYHIHSARRKAQP